MNAMRSRLAMPVIAAVAALLFIFPHALRWWRGNTALMGEYPYFYLMEGSASDLLSALIASMHGMPLVAAAAMVAAMALTTLACAALLKRNGAERNTAAAALFLFVTAPTTIYLSSYLNPYGLALLLTGISMLLLTTRLPWLAVLPLIPLLWLDRLALLCAAVLLLAYLGFRREKRTMLLTALLALGALAAQAALRRPWLLERLPGYVPALELFADIGALHGFGLFLLLLAIAGLVRSRKEKGRMLPAYGAMLAFAVLGLMLSPHALLFATPLIVLFAAHGLAYFWERPWELNLMRHLTAAVLLYGVLFSAVAYGDRIADTPPTAAMVESLTWLRQRHEPATVLSHPQKSFWISYYANHSPFTSYNDPRYEERWAASREIFRSRDLKNTTQLLAQSNITFIWIDAAMKQGQVWSEEDAGLLFLFRNERFKRIYYKDEIEIWEVQREEP